MKPLDDDEINSEILRIKEELNSEISKINEELNSEILRINNEISRIQRESELDRMNNVFYLFGSEISNLEYANYPDEVKNMYKEILIRKMKVELENL